MAYDPERHHRRSIRLRGYDDAQPGVSFVTICVEHRLHLLGSVIEGEARLNEAGCMVGRWWDELPAAFPGLLVDAFVVMPNHVHGIVLLGAVGDDSVAGAIDGRAGDTGAHAGVPLHNPSIPTDSHSAADPAAGPASLSTVVQWFKTMTTNAYIGGVKQRGWDPFPGRLWQRNYYEQVLRTDAGLERARRYIAANPVNWQDDEDNVARQRAEEALTPPVPAQEADGRPLPQPPQSAA